MTKSLLKQFQDLLPLPPVWEAERITGSILVFDMGNKIEEQFGDLPDFVRGVGKSFFRGQFVLTINLCSWVLYKGDKKVLNNNCFEDSEYEDCLAHLCGQRIIEVKMKEGENCVEFHFSHGWLLSVSADLSTYDDDDDLFSFHELDGFEIDYSPYRGFYVSDD